MDSGRFDALTRSLFAGSTRRHALVAALGGAAGSLGLAEIRAANSGKCKPKCDECEKCKKGDCTRNNGKTRCKQGKCRPKASGTPCTGGICQGGRCTATAPFCTGKDTCKDGNVTEFPCHQSGTTPCVCVIDAITDAPVCAQSPFTNRGCKEAIPCPAGEICVDNTGGLCSGGSAKCALPCPNPL
jgi:hypothetical protein